MVARKCLEKCLESKHCFYSVPDRYTIPHRVPIQGFVIVLRPTDGQLVKQNQEHLFHFDSTGKLLLFILLFISQYHIYNPFTFNQYKCSFSFIFVLQNHTLFNQSNNREADQPTHPLLENKRRQFWFC